MGITITELTILQGRSREEVTRTVRNLVDRLIFVEVSPDEYDVTPFGKSMMAHIDRERPDIRFQAEAAVEDMDAGRLN